MMSTAIGQVMSRVSAIQHMAGRTNDSFAGALGTAMKTPATQVPPAAVIAGSTPLTPETARTGPATAQPSSVPDLPAGAGRWAASIERAARAEGVDPALLTAVVWAESGFRQEAVSHAGAIGLAQLMPGTADLLGVDPYDPEQNLAGGARFLKAMIDKFGRVDLALAAYNAGPARVASLHDGGPGVPVSEAYVATVLDRYRSLGGTR